MPDILPATSDTTMPWQTLFAFLAAMQLAGGLPAPINVGLRQSYGQAASVQFSGGETAHVDAWAAALGAARPAVVEDPVGFRMYRFQVDVCDFHVEVWARVDEAVGR